MADQALNHQSCPDNAEAALFGLYLEQLSTRLEDHAARLWRRSRPLASDVRAAARVIHALHLLLPALTAANLFGGRSTIDLAKIETYAVCVSEYWTAPTTGRSHHATAHDRTRARPPPYL
jgi:hypothetical protein